METKTLILSASAAAIATAAFMILMPDRESLLEDWNPEYRQLCSSFGENAEFGEYNGVRESAERIRGYLNQSPIGRATDQYIVERDLAFCFGEAVSEYSDVAKHPRTEAYLINNELTDEAIALEILKSKIGKNARSLVSNNSLLTPEDAIAWSRIGGAHREIAGLHQLFLTAGYSTSSPFWQVVLEDDRYGDLAQIFTDNYNETYSVDAALYAAFTDDLNTRIVDDNATRTFLSWYETELHDRVVPTVVPCMDFEGNLSVCASTETVAPPEGTGQHALSSETLIELGTHLFTEGEAPVSYISTDQAMDLIAWEELGSVPSSLYSDYRDIENRAEELGNGYQASGTGSFGISMGGRFAFTF